MTAGALVTSGDPGYRVTKNARTSLRACRPVEMDEIHNSSSADARPTRDWWKSSQAPAAARLQDPPGRTLQLTPSSWLRIIGLVNVPIGSLSESRPSETEEVGRVVAGLVCVS